MALITCPDCGRQISDRAHSCPHCGAINDDKIARKVHKSAHHAGGRVRNGLLNGRMSRKKMWTTVIVCVIAAGIVSGVGFAIYHNRQLAAQEQARYDMLMDNFSIADAQTFLLHYPDTKHLKEIEDNIALYQRYEQEWQKIANSANADDFAMFRSKYPDSPFDHKAYDKIDSLDWIHAKRSDTEGALRKYLDLHPDGKYAELAREQRQYIIDTRPTMEERDLATRVINAYFAALKSRNKEALNNITTAEMFIRSCDFIDAHEGVSATDYAITSPVSVSKKPTDNGAIYAATCTVSRGATATGGTETQSAEATTSATVKVTATLNSAMQISALDMTIEE